MTQQASTTAHPRKLHYSFLRPGDFVRFLFLIGITTFLFQLSLRAKGILVVPRLGGAVVSLFCVAWFTWLRHARRHTCKNSGEFMFAAFTPVTFFMICEQWATDILYRCWPLDSGFLFLLSYFGFLVWQAPRKARDIAKRKAICETKDCTEQRGL